MFVVLNLKNLKTMSQSSNLPKWVNTSNKGQVQRAKYLAELRKELLTKSEELTPIQHLTHYQDTSLQPVERLIWGVFLLADVMEQISEIDPEIEGAKGVSHVLMTELASNLQGWVMTGDDNLITVPLDLCQVVFNELMETQQ